jgi:hypothetical protein
MKAILLSKDLMFISRVKEVSSACGGEVSVVKNEAALHAAVSAVGQQERGVVLLDLEKCPLPLDSVQQVVSGLPAQSWRCVCFFSHVHVEVAEEARRRGLGDVMPRSKFVQLLPGFFSA